MPVRPPPADSGHGPGGLNPSPSRPPKAGAGGRRPAGGTGGGIARAGRWQEVGDVRRRASVTLDGSGNGTVTFDVWSANHKWMIEDIQLQTSQAQTTAPYPTATAYLGGQQVGVQEGASWVGNQDVMRGRIEMTAGDTLTVAFTGGSAGSVATAIIEGVSYLWR